MYDNRGHQAESLKCYQGCVLQMKKNQQLLHGDHTNIRNASTNRIELPATRPWQPFSLTKTP